MENILQKFLESNDYKIEQAIVEGKLEFEIADNKEGTKFTKYRIRTPEFKDKIRADREKDKLRLKLMHEDGYEFKDKLIELYKQKGIDIDKLDKKFEEIQAEINDKYLALAKLGKSDETEEDKKKILNIKEEINELLNKQVNISAEKYNLTKYSIEDQCNQHYIIWLSILCTDYFDKENKKWKQLYTDITEWENGKEEVNNIVLYYSGYMFLFRGEMPNA